MGWLKLSPTGPTYRKHTIFTFIYILIFLLALSQLKTKHLQKVLHPDESALETLVSCCPVLEELKIFVARNNDANAALQVQSRSLKRLNFIQVSYSQFDSALSFVVDAPLLRFLSVYDNDSSSFVVNNLESNAKLDIILDFGLEPCDEASVSAVRRRSRIRSFLPGISRVRDMTVDAGTLKVIHEYSKLEPLPQFRCLSRLFVTLCVSDLKCLFDFLESCPNLKSLILPLDDYEEMRYEEMNQISYSCVPECFSQSLEFLELVMPISGYAAETKLVKYFLENSAILKLFTLHIVNHDYDDSFNELLKIPRRSATCQVVVI